MRYWESKKWSALPPPEVKFEELTPEQQQWVFARKLEGDGEPLRYFYRDRGTIINIIEVLEAFKRGGDDVR